MTRSNIVLAALLVVLFAAGIIYRAGNPEPQATPVAEETSENPDNRLAFNYWGGGVHVRILEGLDGTGVYVFQVRDPQRSHFEQEVIRGNLTSRQVAELGAYLEKASFQAPPGQGAEAPVGSQDWYQFRYKQITRAEMGDVGQLNRVLSEAPHIGSAYQRALEQSAQAQKAYRTNP